MSDFADSQSRQSPESPLATTSSTQEPSYFTPNTSHLQNEHSNDSSSISPPLRNSPGGPVYTRQELLNLKKSPLVAPPPGMPARKEWFGEFNEQAAKSKDHDGLSTTRTRHRREGDSEDTTRTFESTRSLFKSGPAQPSQMGSFRHQSYRDRGGDIDKDTANLKSIAERYDRGERLNPLSPGLAGLTRGFKDRDKDSAPHLSNSSTSVPRIGAVPRRGTGLAGESGRGPGERESRPRKLGDEAADWRKNADPGRERSERNEGRTGRERDPSRSRDDTNERRRRDRSRGGDDDTRRWREESNARDKDRRGRDPSSTRDESGRGKKRPDGEEDRRRKEERESKPAWLDDDAPVPNGGPKGFMSLGKGGDGELDELQKWKLEKKAKEGQKEREDREATTANNSTDAGTEVSTAGEALYSSSASSVNTNAEEHKTPRPSNIRYELPSNSNVPPLPSANPQDSNVTAPAATTTMTTSSDATPANALATIKALMSKSQGEQSPVAGVTVNGMTSTNGPPTSTFGAVSAMESPQGTDRSTSFSSVISRPVQSASSSVKYDSDENRRPIVCTADYDPPMVSRHAFARPANQVPPSNDSNIPSPTVKNPSAHGPPGLRSLQTTVNHDFHSVQHPARGSQNASPAQSLSSMSGSERRNDSQLLSSFLQRAPPPHMANVNPTSLDNAGIPIFHLPASAGAAGASKDPNVSVLSVLAPQPQQPQPHLTGMGGPGHISVGGSNVATAAARQQTTSPQQNLLTRLGILGDQGRRPSPKQLDNAIGGYDRVSDLRMPIPQQQFRLDGGNINAAGLGRGSYGSPVDERFESQYPQPLSANIGSDGRFGVHNMNQSQPTSASASSVGFNPSPVGGANPAYALSAKGSRLAKFFESARGGEEVVSPPTMHASNMGASHMQRQGPLHPSHQQEEPSKGQGVPDLLTLLQHAAQQPNHVNGAPQQAMYRDEMAMSRHRELALQQQQQQLIREREREREARHREAQQQLYAQSSDFFDGRGSFVPNELVPGLRPPVQRNERDPYTSDRLDERLALAAHGRVPGVPGGGYEQMMRSMSLNAPVRNNANIYSTGMANGQGSVSMGGGQMAAELLQQQQQQQRERERQRQIQLERAQLLAMQGSQQLGGRNPGVNLQAQLGPRGNPLDQFSRGGRIPSNDVQQQQFGGFNGLGSGMGPSSAGLGNFNLNNGGFPNGGMPSGNNQLNGANNLNGLNGFDGPVVPGRQPLMNHAQQRQANLGNLGNPGMGYDARSGLSGLGGAGGLESRYGQQNQMPGLGVHSAPQMNAGSSGGGQQNDLISLFLAGSAGNHQN